MSRGSSAPSAVSVVSGATASTAASTATQQLEAPDSESPVAEVSVGQAVINATRPTTAAVTKLVAAMGAGSKTELAAAAHQARKTVVELLRSVKEVENHPPPHCSESQRNQLSKQAQQCADSVVELLQEAGRTGGKVATPDVKKKALELSRQIAEAVGGLAQLAAGLDRSADGSGPSGGLVFVDGFGGGGDAETETDVSLQAEQELLSAADAIDAAAKKLTVAQPSDDSSAAPARELSFEEQIMQGTKAIAAASFALVRAAGAAQRESSGIAMAGIEGDTGYSEDAQWSTSLVSAAKIVAHATQGLCDAAQNLAQGGVADDKLIASAKSVANSTAQLLLACRVKGTPGPAMERLQNAGKAVKRAADNLLQAAQQSRRAALAAVVDNADQLLGPEGGEAEADGGALDLSLEERPVLLMAQELDAVEAILKQERELEMAKRTLAKIRAAKYKRGGEWKASVRSSKR